NSRPYVFSPGTSSWVRTAWTPGIVTASATSISRMRACACGLRTVWPQSIPGATRSLEYANSPFTFGTPSARSTTSPMRPTSSGREHEAGADEHAVEEHRAGTALPLLAGVLRAWIPELLAEREEQRLALPAVRLGLDAVHA